MAHWQVQKRTVYNQYLHGAGENALTMGVKVVLISDLMKRYVVYSTSGKSVVYL